MLPFPVDTCYRSVSHLIRGRAGANRIMFPLLFGIALRSRSWGDLPLVNTSIQFCNTEYV